MNEGRRRYGKVDSEARHVKMAYAEGIEPPLAVLEAFVLPLNDAYVKTHLLTVGSTRA
jgi:hypothetical protein